MNVLFLQRYNNYANRIIKRNELYIEDVLDVQASENKETFLLENVNFNPNDGVTTELIVGDTTTNQFPGWIPDYIIVYNPADKIHVESLNKDFTPFNSTWFVTEAERTRSSQYKLGLKRDVIRDNYDSIKQADIYVEKGTVDSSDSFIFNPEGSNLNQIKKSEILLKDPTECQWIVGYVVQDSNPYQDLSAVYSVPPSGAIINWSSVPITIQRYIDFAAGNTGKKTVFLSNYDSKANYEIFYKIVNQIFTAFVPVDNYASVTTKPDGYYTQGTGTDNSGFKPAGRFIDALFMTYDVNDWKGWKGIEKFTNKVRDDRAYIMQKFRTDMGIERYNDYISLLYYNGKVIYNGTTGKYYKITVEELGDETISKTYTYSDPSLVKSRIRQLFYESSSTDTRFEYESETSSTDKYFKLTTKRKVVRVTATEQSSNSISWTISGNRKHLVKEPYDMFCIPYGDFSTKNFKIDKEASLAAARAVALKGIGATNAIVYDIQLLPYCPLQNTIRSNSFNETLLTEHEDYEYVYGPQKEKLSIVYWCTESEFTFDIPCRIDVENVKVETECDMYRLCSPNYSGLFEFNIAKNGGLSFFNIDCSYKPYQPYIHINPNFGGLYGQDFNDSRGLICGGDFSLSMTTNAWENYKLQNKNYQAIFDREIQKMDNEFALNISTNSVKRGVSAIEGIAKGAMTSGWAGAIVGAVKGAVNIATETVNDSVGYNLERDYRKDMFNLQNGNIKALPNSLAKTDPFTFNNKKWPFLEKYSCTDEEREAFKKKIRFNGMNIGRIGKLLEFTNPTEQRFFQGQLIRDNFIMDDSHMVDAIYSELAKGVYI